MKKIVGIPVVGGWFYSSEDVKIEDIEARSKEISKIRNIIRGKPVEVRIKGGTHIGWHVVETQIIGNLDE